MTVDVTSEPAGGPLAGVRVIEISTGRVGRIAGMLLADLGADVVTVVAPGRPSRPQEPADICWDRGKRQLEAPAEDVLRLAADADVMLVNATPADIAARGLTSQWLHEVAPAVVHVWLPPYGESGEWRDLPEDPLFLAALTSLAVHLPADDASPVAPVVSTLSSIQGALGAAAAVAGLVGRYRSGCAQPAVVTGLHAGAALMGTAFTEINDEPAFFLAAPLSATVLADFGADVIRVEPPAGDTYRTYPLSFLAVNQRKRGMALDLGDPACGEIVHTLLASTDVLVENLRPPARARLGLVDTTTRHPHLVHCSVSAFGDAGRWADLPGFDPILQSMNGMARAQGGDGDPIVGSAGVNDVTTGALSALGILAALYWRERTGQGQRVRTSLAVGSAFTQAAEYTTWDGAPEPLRGGELFRGPAAGNRYYECADGWIATAAQGDPGRATSAARPVP
jgi:crotonobetainyl-CoA:carnitine CoA-transferase CaiB-like acyl-CoA transferase